MADPDFYRKIAHQRYENAAQVAQDAGATSQAALNDAYLNLYGVNGSTDWTPEEDWAQQFEQYNDVPMYVPNYNQQKAMETEAHEGEGQAYNYDEYFRPRETPKTAAQVMTNTPNTAQKPNADNRETSKRVSDVDKVIKDSVDTTLGGNNQEPKSNVQSGYEQEPQEQEQEQEQEEPTEASSNVVVKGARDIIDNAFDRLNVESGRNDELNPRVERETQSAQSNEDYRNDPDKLSQLQQEFYNEQQRREDQARDIERNSLLAQYGQTGINSNDQLVQQAIQNVEPTQSSFDLLRRITDSEGNLETNPLNWNLLGFSSQQQSSDAAKNLYDYWYNMEENQKAEQERQPYINPNQGKKEQEASNWMLDEIANNQLTNPEYANSLAIGKASSDYLTSGIDRTLIDDGTSVESREGPYMTGEQYLRYREEVGIPGRDVALINPDALYSKQDEMENYGFVPYVTSQDNLNRMHDDAAINKVNNFFNGITDLRRNMAGDYTYNYDGRTYSGQDFQNRYVPWYKKMEEAKQTEATFNDPSKVTEDSVPLTYYIIDDNTGEKIRIPANATKVEPSRDDKGLPVLDFGTGDPDDNWYFTSDDDFSNSIKMEFAGDDGYAAEWQNLPPLVMEDGQKIRADKAIYLRDNKDQYADYGDGNWKKPQIEDPFQDGFLPWITDIALGSAPLFWGPTAGAQAIGNSWSGLQGFQPGSQGTNGEYRLLSAVNEDDLNSRRNLTGPTGAQRLTSATASAALPSTERIWGSVAGKEAITRFPFFKRLAESRPDIANNPVVQWLTGTLGEGIEEIPGNLVEEAQSTGSFLNGDYFANPLYYDENGNITTNAKLVNGEDASPVVDAYGRQLRDRNTNPFDRNANFWNEAPLAALGGATLGAGFSTLQTPSAIRQYKRDMDEYNDVGYNLVIPQSVQEYTRRQQGGE